MANIIVAPSPGMVDNLGRFSERFESVSLEQTSPAYNQAKTYDYRTSQEPRHYALSSQTSASDNVDKKSRGEGTAKKEFLDYRVDKDSFVTARNGLLLPTKSSDIADMLCIGMGPASLAIAIALADKFQELPCNIRRNPKVQFLELQSSFAWHPGMQIPDATMQISFLKDLATPRNAASPFTFVRYLQEKKRFNEFLNLSTFLPTRLEYDDYMRWCAEKFTGVTTYNSEVQAVHPRWSADKSTVEAFTVTYKDRISGKTHETIARNVVISTGGSPNIPPQLESFTKPERNAPLAKVVHSSQFMTSISKIEGKAFAVIGSGQSAAEIFMDLCTRFPNSEVTLLCRSDALKPSDDSPFVNEVFDPEQTDHFHSKGKDARKAIIARNQATNYSVVRLELIDRIYQHLYMQNFSTPDQPRHRRRHRILFNTEVKSAKAVGSEVHLELAGVAPMLDEPLTSSLAVDQIFVATGYKRNMHEQILKDTADLRDSAQVDAQQAEFPIGRDYRVKYDSSRVPVGQCGVWLQGCNEETHGLSDSLLSVLAVRGGELVDSIFGDTIEAQKREFEMD